MNTTRAIADPAVRCLLRALAAERMATQQAIRERDEVQAALDIMIRRWLERLPHPNGGDTDGAASVGPRITRQGKTD